jgi:hypothetical protein
MANYTGADSVVMLNEALNADQLNAPDYKNIPHLFAWNLSSDALQYVNTLNGLIENEINTYFSGYRNYLVVDAVYGDDAIAATDPYKSTYSFATIQAAVDNIGGGGNPILIVVNPGLYELDNRIELRNNIDFYFYPNTIVQDKVDNLSPGLFSIDSCNVNIYGYADFISNNNKATAFSYTNTLGFIALLNFNCNKIILTDEGLVFNVSVTNLIINFQETDCSFGGCRFLTLSGEKNVTINASIIKHSNTAYIIDNSSATLTINVENTISYNNASGNSTILMGNCNTCKVFLNGNISSAQTQDNISLGALTILQNCNNSSIIFNGGNCNIRSRGIFRCIGLNCSIRINANITNTQVNGIMGYISNDSVVYLAGRLQADQGVSSIIVGVPRAIFVLEYGSLITNINPSIANNIVGFNMFYCLYYGATNNAPQITTTPLASQLIVNSNVI